MNKRALFLRTLFLMSAVLTAASCGGGDDSAGVTDRPMFPPCRKDVMEHVRQPSRLEVLNECTSFSGTVREVDDSELDGDYVLHVEPDPEYVNLLAAPNSGLLAVAVVSVDRPGVDAPVAGQHASFYGALVTDKTSDRRVELHPTWLIAVLSVAVTASDTVVVGDALSIQIAVTSVTKGVTAQISEAELFLEVIDSQGRATRWESGRTNTSGTANFEFAALELAGDYTLQVFASKDRQRGLAEAAFTVKRR